MGSRLERVEGRAREVVAYFVETQGTVRSVAAELGMSKNTVYKDITEHYPVNRDPSLYNEAQELLQRNKDERHIRGGLSTRRKWKKQ